MIRKEVRDKLKFIAEPMVWGGLALLLLLWTFSISDTAHWIFLACMLLIAVLMLTAFWISVTRLRLSRQGNGKGVVLVDERRVGYFGTDDEGGFVDISALMRLEVRGAYKDRSWVLYHEDGAPLVISQNASGADQLLDVFSVLSGLSLARFSQVFEAQGDTVELLWERERLKDPRTVH